MPSRADLVVQANSLNIDHTSATYVNDSKLEQAIIYAGNNLGNSNSATTVATSANTAGRRAGGANI